MASGQVELPVSNLAVEPILRTSRRRAGELIPFRRRWVSGGRNCFVLRIVIVKRVIQVMIG